MHLNSYIVSHPSNDRTILLHNYSVPGDRLPTIRTLATDLDVAANTVARAYRELIATGICVAAGRRGTFVADEPPVAFDVATRSEVLTDAAVAFAQTARELDVPIDEALEAVIAAMRSPALLDAEVPA